MSHRARSLWLLVLVGSLGLGYATRGAWGPPLRAELLRRLGGATTSREEHPTAHDDHDHAAHDDDDLLELTPQAQANLGLTLTKITPTTFDRSVTIPGMIVERPGRTTLAVTAPLTGVVTEIHPIQGEAVAPGRKLFELRLTHEELVQGQSDFLRVAEELDVVEQEIARLEKIAVDGGIAGRQVLERRYEQQNKQAVLRAQHQALLLHGLTEAQVGEILRTRTLLKTLTVAVPKESADERGAPPVARSYEVQELRAVRGENVEAGETLAVLADHSELDIEGSAFDRDVDLVRRALETGRSITATIETDDLRRETIPDLKILYVAGKVDAQSQTYRFYLPLTNRLERDKIEAGDRRFIGWRYHPGRRVQLAVPVEQWTDRIVLPAEAVAQDGAETYVFMPEGDRFRRRPVHIEYRDPTTVVIANDGSLFPGDSVATSGAQQLHRALKNRSACAVDPHAGHNH